MNSRTLLEKSLGEFLGFEDGVSDVLEHLLTIESREDLLEYLSQLLGTSDDDKTLSEFVDNVCRHQRGEPLVTTNGPAEATTTTTREINQKKSPMNYRTNNNNNSKNNKQSKQTKKASQKTTTTTVASGKKAPPKASAANSTTQKNNSNPTTQNLQRAPDTLGNDPQQQQQKQQQATEVVQPKPIVPPPRGKATIVCGCFGNTHPPLTNCLYCGRISCLKEGYSFCPFCEYLVEKIAAPTHETEKSKAAWIHKERLLRYDKESTQRTIVLDDQSDFFTNNHQKLWLSEEERRQAEENEWEQKQSARQRPKQQLTIGL